jgi:succinate dehydrogenase / fumarate reductase flavoprotein subunit
MLMVSEAVAFSALARKESRGAHSRIDHPNYDETWGKQNNIVERDGEEMRLKQVPIADMPPELHELLNEK